MSYRWKAGEWEDYQMEGGFHESESCDPRDATPDPPAMLDPLWVLRMRKRVTRFMETGIVDWMPMKNLEGEK